MTDNLSHQQTEEFLRSNSVSFRSLEYPDTVSSSVEAAKEIGIDINRMLKSLLFKAGDDFLLFLVPVPKRLDKAKVESFLNKKISMASKDEVLEVTGYPIGVVCPFNLRKEVPIYIEETVFAFPEVTTASGTRGFEIALAPRDLLKVTHATSVSVVEEK